MDSFIRKDLQLRPYRLQLLQALKTTYHGLRAKEICKQNIAPLQDLTSYDFFYIGSCVCA